MRTQFIPNESSYENTAANLAEAEDLMSWACTVVEVDGGFQGFESHYDYETWRKQI